MTNEAALTVKERYERALLTLTETLRQDSTILAAILGGSLSHDEVWEKSDIDLLIIGDEKHKERMFGLVEDDIVIHAIVMPRSAFKKAIEGSLQSSFFHSFFSKTRLLYTHDPSLVALYENIHHLGAHDRALQLLKAGNNVLPVLAKAEKWFYVKSDLHYAFLWILACVDGLAKIEVAAASQIAGREVVHQALALNPVFFSQIYSELIDGPKDAPCIEAALRAINTYMDERVPLLFKPIFDYLHDAGGPRTTTELNEHFKNRAQTVSLENAYEWLALKNHITRLSTPLRLSEKSRVTVPEAAYYYDE